MATATVVEKQLEEASFFEFRRQARLELARLAAKEKDILLWGKILFPDKFPLSYCQEMHGYFVKIRGEPFTNTEAPRNHAKTTVKCFLIPIFQALEEPETFKHYLNVQATMPKAFAVNTAIRTELEVNELIRDLYGNQKGERWTDQQFVMKNGVIFTAIGTGQSIRGLNYNNERPAYLIIDDLYDEEDINNVDATEKKNMWFWSSLYPARAKSKRCSVHMQGTAINPEDLLEKLKKHPGVASKTFKAIKDWDRKVVLWPELNSFETLQAELELMGSVIFYRELQNERRDETSAIIKRSWLRDWEYDPAELRMRLLKGGSPTFFIQEVIVGNDPSIGKDSEGDATGTALILVSTYSDGTGKEYWIEGLWNEQLTLEKRIDQLVQIAASRPRELPVTRVMIEAISGFDDYASEVIRRTNLPVRRVERVKDKITTREVKSHYFENKKVHLNKNIEPRLKDMLVNQLTANHPKNDDAADSVFLCLEDQSGLWNFVR